MSKRVRINIRLYVDDLDPALKALDEAFGDEHVLISRVCTVRGLEPEDLEADEYLRSSGSTAAGWIKSRAPKAGAS